MQFLSNFTQLIDAGSGGHGGGGGGWQSGGGGGGGGGGWQGGGSSGGGSAGGSAPQVIKVIKVNVYKNKMVDNTFLPHFYPERIECLHFFDHMNCFK